MEPNAIILLGDSIAGRIRHLKGMDIYYCPGATTTHWLHIITSNTLNIPLDKVKGVFLMVGTNDIGNNIHKVVRFQLTCICNYDTPQAHLFLVSKSHN